MVTAEKVVSSKKAGFFPSPIRISDSQRTQRFSDAVKSVVLWGCGPRFGKPPAMTRADWLDILHNRRRNRTTSRATSSRSAGRGRQRRRTRSGQRLRFENTWVATNRLNTSRRGAKAQRNALIFLCAFAPLREVLLLSAKPAADLIHHQRSDVRQPRHVREGERRPPPAFRFAADHRQRRGTLAAQREKYHQR